MATLQKIRNHGVLLAIIIGGALFAFIAGDLLKNGSTMLQQSRQNVAEVGGEKISIDDYQKAVEQMKKVYEVELGKKNFNEQEISQIRNSVWESMVNEILLEKEAEKVGLTVSPEELTDALIGKNIHPLITQRKAFVNPETGQFSRESLLQFYNSLFGENITDAQDQSNVNEAKAYWLFWENEVAKSLLQEKYVKLLLNTIGVSGVEAKFNFDARNLSYNANYVVNPYYSVSDSTIQVTEKEIKARYKKNRELYKQDPNRSIKYVSFKVEPLAEDFDKAAQWIEKVEKEFRETDDIIGLVNQESDKSYVDMAYSKSQVPANLKEFAFNNPKGAIFGPIFENNTYTMARILEAGIMQSDSVKIRHIALLPTDKQKADSLMTVLKKGADFAKVARENSLVRQTAVKGGEIGWVNRLELDRDLKGVMFSKGVKEIFKVDNAQGIQIFQILQRTPAKRKVKLAILERKVTPSNSSYSKIYNDAKQFAVNGNTEEKFEAVAKEKGYVVRKADYLLENSDNINRIPQTRQVVKWVFDNDKGTVSDVFDCDRTQFLVACVSDINETEFAKLDMVKEGIKAQLIQEKKAEQMIKALAEKQAKNPTLEGLATAMGTEVKTADNVNFGSFQFGEAGFEPTLIGQLTTLSKDKVSQPLKGNNGVYVVKITNVTKDATAYNEKLEKEQLNSKIARSLPYLIMQSLKEEYDVKDNRSRFY